jgi:hypothetical protein
VASAAPYAINITHNQGIIQMFTLVVVAVYTALVLIFVPLNKISNAQTKARAWWKKLSDKAKS